MDVVEKWCGDSSGSFVNAPGDSRNSAPLSYYSGAMPWSYEIDADHRLVRARAWGVLTHDQITALRLRYTGDPAFRPDVGGCLVNYAEPTEFQLTDDHGLTGTRRAGDDEPSHVETRLKSRVPKPSFLCSGALCSRDRRGVCRDEFYRERPDGNGDRHRRHRRSCRSPSPGFGSGMRGTPISPLPPFP